MQVTEASLTAQDAPVSSQTAAQTQIPFPATLEAAAEQTLTMTSSLIGGVAQLGPAWDPSMVESPPAYDAAEMSWETYVTAVSRFVTQRHLLNIVSDAEWCHILDAAAADPTQPVEAHVNPEVLQEMAVLYDRIHTLKMEHGLARSAVVQNLPSSQEQGNPSSSSSGQ